MIQYACISEVWGTNDMDSRKKKSKKSSGMGQPMLPAQEKSEPLCDLHQGRVDNIMDTYLTDYPFDKYARVTKVSAEDDLPSVRQICQRDREPAGSKRQVSVEPSQSTYDLTKKNAEGPIPELDDGYFPYEQYFKQDTQTLKSRLAQEEARQEEDDAQAIERAMALAAAAKEKVASETARATIGRTLADDDTEGDDYTYNRRSLIPAGAFKTDTMDLFAYVASGILLIFIMEQFLRIGLYMRA
jgi:hypothetical protein